MKILICRQMTERPEVPGGYEFLHRAVLGFQTYLQSYRVPRHLWNGCRLQLWLPRSPETSSQTRIDITRRAQDWFLTYCRRVSGLPPGRGRSCVLLTNTAQLRIVAFLEDHDPPSSAEYFSDLLPERGSCYQNDPNCLREFTKRYNVCHCTSTQKWY